MAENTAPKQPRRSGRPFKKGQSGNPAGKPAGARHAATVMAERLLAADAEEVIKAVIEKAKSGDMVAARLVVERLVPPRRDSAVSFTLPAIDTASDAQKAGAAILAAVAAGSLTPGEAGDVLRLIEGFARIVEVTDIEARIGRLEAEQTRAGGTT